jgi:hypothetical protein
MTRAGAARWSARALLAASLAATALFAASGRDGWLPFVVWLGGCAAAAAAWCEDVRLPRPSRGDLLAALSITALGAFFRLHRLYEVPYGFWIDEARIAQQSAALFAWPGFVPFGTTPLIPAREDYVRIPNLYVYFCGALQWASGFGRLGAKMISVAPGIAAVPLLYAFARASLPRGPAVLAAGFLAVSAWHASNSRWGWEQVLTTTLTVAMFLCVRRALAERRLAAAVQAGMLAGLSLYADEAARVAWGAAVLVFALEIAVRRGRFQERALGLFLLGSVVTALPLFIIWLRQPEVFGARVNELWIGGFADGGLGTLAHRLKAHLLMFHVAGDPMPRHNPGGGPMLHPAVGILFAGGLVLALVRLRQLDARLCLVWLGTGLLAGVLSASEHVPHAYRTGLVAPVCCVLAAAAAHEALRAARPARLRAALPVAAAALLAAVAVGGYRDLFVRAIETGAAREASVRGAPARQLGDALAALTPDGGLVYVDRALRHVELKAELARFAPAAWRRRLAGRDGERQTAVLWLADRSPEALDFAVAQPRMTRIYVTGREGALPETGGIRVEELRDPDGPLIARLAIADPEGGPRGCGLRRSLASDAAVRTDEWTGVLEIAQPGVYGFRLESDRPATLRLGDALALSIEKTGRMRRREDRVPLERGHHPLVLQHQNGSDADSPSLRWAPRDELWSEIPCALLSPEPPAP